MHGAIPEGTISLETFHEGVGKMAIEKILLETEIKRLRLENSELRIRLKEIENGKN